MKKYSKEESKRMVDEYIKRLNDSKPTGKLNDGYSDKILAYHTDNNPDYIGPNDGDGPSWIGPKPEKVELYFADPIRKKRFYDFIKSIDDISNKYVDDIKNKDQ
ncbi:MAG: hypothetical protein AABY32_02625 [Nanoarchaeota archaeon]